MVLPEIQQLIAFLYICLCFLEQLCLFPVHTMLTLLSTALEL